MKPAPTSVRTIRSSTSPSRDRVSAAYALFTLTPSPIATSSRVRLPPPPLLIRPLSFHEKRYASTSPGLRYPPSPISLASSPASPARTPPLVEQIADFRFRPIHTSAPANAQPLEREYEDYDDSYSDVSGDWEASAPFTAEEVASLARLADAGRQLPVASPRGVKVGGKKAVGRVVAEYEPTEADFGAGGSSLGEDISWADEYVGGIAEEDLRAGMDVWEEPAKKPKKRTRKMRVQVPDLPPLQAGQVLRVEEERYDWRSTALSQKPRAGGERWFPEQRNIKRERQKVEDLKEGEAFYEPQVRYYNHFVPLLEAEHEEELRAHAERQLQWSHDRLKKEGYMIEDLVASEYRPPKRKETFAYQFSWTTKGGSLDLPFHIFKSGTIVEVCRTHPHYDYVLLDGKTNKPAGQSAGADASDTPLLAGPIEKLTGSVYSVGKKFIRVAFPVRIEGIETGRWRLDSGCNDISLKRQLEAIDFLNADPTKTERLDAARAADQAARLRALTVGMSDEDEALHQPPRGIKTLQTVFHGTNLRDKLLRAFQEEFVPYDTSASLQIGENLPGIPALPIVKPDDIDATPIPPPHPSSELPSILAKNELIASWTKRYRADDGRPPVRVEGDPDVPLNATQLRAIAMMLSERLSLVQGPPGTGKTRVIIETIKLLKQHWKIPHPILVTAHTNAAVDNLLGGLRAHGVKAARLGNEHVVREDLKEWTVERLSEVHPLFRRWEELGEEMQFMNNVMNKVEGAPTGHYGDMPTGQLYKEKVDKQQLRRALKMAITRETLLDADVICTTCLSAASWTLDAIDFPVVFLDEASMATEPLSLIPLMKGSSHVAIIGDHKQLPPVIVSEAGQLGGLATSMFERLIHEHNIPSIMLDTQYRMHPQISHFPNRAFYASALANGTADPSGIVKAGFEPPNTVFLLEDDDGKRQNVTFVHHDSPEDPSSRSIRNLGEADKVCDVVTDLLLRNPTLLGKDIGVITPYVAQIRQLTDYLRLDPDRRAGVARVLGEERAKELDAIEIRTVDGFEGREKAVIVFSTVRNNPGGYIGFMADWRRLNVGLTRAKRGLIILGSADHLARSKVGQKAAELLPSGGAQVWRELMAWLDREGLILRADD